jgi:hypothetical protein
MPDDKVTSYLSSDGALTALHRIAGSIPGRGSMVAFFGEASPIIWSCYANYKSLFISLEIDCFHGL